MPKLPHHHAHYPDKKAGVSKCRCGDTVLLPMEPVKPPPTEKAGISKPITWEGIRQAVAPLTKTGEYSDVAVTENVVRYLLSRGVDVAPPF
jgi:hypothetical protein